MKEFLSRVAQAAKDNLSDVIYDKQFEIYNPSPDDVDESLLELMGIETPLTRSQVHAMMRWITVVRDLPGVEEDENMAILFEIDEECNVDYDTIYSVIKDDEAYLNMYREIRASELEEYTPSSKYRKKFSLSKLLK